MKHCVSVLLLVISPVVLATEFNCTNGSAERTIKVVYTQENSPVPCQVVYEKKNEGTVEYPWNANNQVGYCEEKAKYLAERLDGFGWQCVAPASAEE